MTVEVSESGVLFGTFDDANVLLIEQAVTEAKLDSNGVKSVEFVLLHRMRDEQPAISLVEAKTSIPRDSGSFFSKHTRKNIAFAGDLVSSCTGATQVFRTFFTQTPTKH